MTCPICLSPMSEPVEALFALPSVASDCRPWSKGRSVLICSGCGAMRRITNKDFNPDVYKEYTSYPEPTGRTATVLDFVKDRMPVPKRVLDIGAGNGHGMRIINQIYSDAIVFGYEPTINIERPKDKFDLITLFHVFEHVTDLHEMLAYIKSSLTDNGHLLIQVPYAAMWPFDLVIADHEWHFTKNSLAKLLNEARYRIIYLGNDSIKKEITLLAQPIERSRYQFTCPWAEENPAIDWLIKFKSKLDTIKEPVAVYGTSVSAMWAAMILGDKVRYYLDDDINRIGMFNGKRVYRPYRELPVVAPFPDWQLESIKEKHPKLRFL